MPKIFDKSALVAVAILGLGTLATPAYGIATLRLFEGGQHPPP